MYRKTLRSLIIVSMALGACQAGSQDHQPKNMKTYKNGSFGYDLNFLQKRDSLVILKTEMGNAQVLVSARYQGKVFTSTADGLEGQSFGWVNYKAFKDELDPHMNGYGGEDRLWLGPEGGKYSLFFKPGAAMEFNNWHTPAAFDSEPWSVQAATTKKVSLVKEMSLQNYAGTLLEIEVNREVEILENSQIEEALGIALGDGIKAVGFKTVNRLTNVGDSAWTEQTGAPCLWNLDMFTPSPRTVIAIPYRLNTTGKVATTDYFGAIPADRVTYKEGVLYFKADGKSRGKLGIPPQRARPLAGSYDAAHKVLTITLFDVDNHGTYLNQEWTAQKNPLLGDAVNAYNDGPLADGKQMGPFYELESVSPAAFLTPGASLTHQHSVFHFTGEWPALNAIAQKTLGVSLRQVENVFH